MGPSNVALVKLFEADQKLREAQGRLDATTRMARGKDALLMRLPLTTMALTAVIVVSAKNVQMTMPTSSCMVKRSEVLPAWRSRSKTAYFEPGC